MSEPAVVQIGVLDMQVCVSKDYTDEQVLTFAEANNPCGTRNGWQIRREGDEALQGAAERTQCAERKDCVHIMLDA